MLFDEETDMLPYGRHSIDQGDTEAVADALNSRWLTTGPRVEEFEQAVAGFSRAGFGVAVNSGTAALHAAMFSIGLRPGDEVIVPAMTFCATANAVVYAGGIPVFIDVDSETLLIDPQKLESKITSKTKAVVAVDYAGHMCDYDILREITEKRNIYLISDACHSIGGYYKGSPSGSCADLSVFSFHPVKNMTTGEGGMIVSDNERLINRAKRFRNHGISTDLHQREKIGAWYYEMEDLGYNYRMPDILAALGISQLKKLPAWIDKRNSIAKAYDHFFNDFEQAAPLGKSNDVKHAYHLYVIRFDLNQTGVSREQVFKSLRQSGLKVNVHYIPVHYHPFYKKKFKTFKGLCPVAEDAYEKILTIPIFPLMKKNDIERVCSLIKKSL